MISHRLLSRTCRRALQTVAGKSRPLSPVINQSGIVNASHDIDPSEFAPKQAVLLRKITRYEYEKQISQITSEEELKTYLANKGSDYDGLLRRHDEYYASLDTIYENLEKRRIDATVVHRLEYDFNLINNADIVFTAGGDGTFLLAASKVKDSCKPVVGINTDPLRSEGYLCLPRNLSSNFDEALEKILAGRFRWTYRQRMRITMSGKHANDDPIHIHDQEMVGSPEHRYHEHVQEHEAYHDASDLVNEQPPRVLPVLALNDIFIGESISARVSYYEMSVDDSLPVKHKSSGVTVCTGTGSSSWFFHINNMSKQSVKEILKIANNMSGTKFDLEDEDLVRKITKAFNCSLKFDPAEQRMAYVVRDPVVNGIFQVANPRGFADRMKIKSRMWDAHIVIDGGYSFQFNDGAIVALTMHPDDALRTLDLG